MLRTDVIIKTALRSGRKQSSVPVYLGKWLERQETDLPVSMVSSWFHSSLYGFICVVVVYNIYILFHLNMVRDNKEGASTVLQS